MLGVVGDDSFAVAVAWHLKRIAPVRFAVNADEQIGVLSPAVQVRVTFGAHADDNGLTCANPLQQLPLIIGPGGKDPLLTDLLSDGRAFRWQPVERFANQVLGNIKNVSVNVFNIADGALGYAKA